MQYSVNEERREQQQRGRTYIIHQQGPQTLPGDKFVLSGGFSSYFKPRNGASARPFSLLGQWRDTRISQIRVFGAAFAPPLN